MSPINEMIEFSFRTRAHMWVFVLDEVLKEIWQQNLSQLQAAKGILTCMIMGSDICLLLCGDIVNGVKIIGRHVFKFFHVLATYHSEWRSFTAI